MSEALPLVESEDLVLVRDSARGLLGCGANSGIG